MKLTKYIAEHCEYSIGAFHDIMFLRPPSSSEAIRTHSVHHVNPGYPKHDGPGGIKIQALATGEARTRSLSCEHPTLRRLVHYSLRLRRSRARISFLSLDESST